MQLCSSAPAEAIGGAFGGSFGGEGIKATAALQLLTSTFTIGLPAALVKVLCCFLGWAFLPVEEVNSAVCSKINSEK